MTPSATQNRRIAYRPGPLGSLASDPGRSAFGLHRRVARELRELRLTSHFGAHVGGELLRRVVGRDGHAERLHASAERGGIDGVVEMLVEEGDDRCRCLAGCRKADEAAMIEAGKTKLAHGR